MGIQRSDGTTNDDNLTSEIEKGLRGGDLQAASVTPQNKIFRLEHTLLKEGDAASEAELQISFMNETFSLKPGNKKIFKDVALTLRARIANDGPGESIVVSTDEIPAMSATAYGSRLIPVASKGWKADFVKPGAVSSINADVEVSLQNSSDPKAMFGTLKIELVGESGTNLSRVLGKPVQGIEAAQLRNYRDELETAAA